MKKAILLFLLYISAISFAQEATPEQMRTIDGNDYNSDRANATIDYDKDVFVGGAIEVNPDYPGGMEAAYAYLKKNIKVTKSMLDKQAPHKVFSKFIVEKNGSLSDIQILRSNSPELSKEFIKALKAMPKWKPGRQNNRNVRTSYTMVFNPN